MASNRKYSNGMWKDTSKKQEKVSGDLFLKLQDLLGKDFQGMGMMFNQVTGECLYRYETIHYTYTMLLNRNGMNIQESMTKKESSAS